MNPKVEQLLELFENNRLRPAGIRFFFIDDKIIHRHVSRYSSSQYYADEFGYIKNLSLERGQVLNVFAKLEEFVNEFIYLKFIDPSAEKEKIFYELAQKVDFGLKIRLLKEWQIVSSGNLSRKIEAINDVKQQLLYIEHIEDVLYKRQSIGIPDVFEKFKEHLLAIIHDIRSLGSEPQTEKSVTVNSFELPLERGSILNKFIELERLLNESLYTRFLLLIAKNINDPL